MLVKKGETLKVHHVRHSVTFTGVAIRDFDTETEEFYPIALYQDEPVRGMNEVWCRGDEIPCRRSLVKINE